MDFGSLFQGGNGNWDSALVSSIISAGAGLAGSYMDQKTKRQAMEQANKQAEDQYKLQQEALARGGGGASAALALQKKAMMIDAYQKYADAYGQAANRDLQGFGQLASSMANPLMMRAK